MNGKEFNPIVTIPSQLIFREPQRQHPNASHSETISKIAKKLEKDYDVLHIFYRQYKSKIKSVIIAEVKRAWNAGRDQEQVNGIIGEKIKNMFRQFMIKEEHGIRTRTAQRENRQSFIKTGAYYKSLKVAVR